MEGAWGKEFLVDAFGCNNAIADRETIYDFVKELVKAIDMVAYGEPQIVHFGTGDKAGYTLLQLIETSNISAHFIEYNNSMCLNVFSCKDFDELIVLKLIEKYFEPLWFDTHTQKRGVSDSGRGKKG